MDSLLIWGAGDQGMVVLECALAMKKYGRIDFLEIKEKGCREIKDYHIYKEEDEELSKRLRAYDEVIVATGNNYLRKQRIAILCSVGASLATILHPSAVFSPSAVIAKGCMVLANAVIHTNASVGTGCIINTASVVEHDCIIEDFVNISPSASLAGHTTIGRGAFLGIGSTVIDNIHIGKEAIIGAGAVVIRDVPDYAVVAGVPAKRIK